MPHDGHDARPAEYSVPHRSQVMVFIGEGADVPWIEWKQKTDAWSDRVLNPSAGLRRSMKKEAHRLNLSDGVGP